MLIRDPRVQLNPDYCTVKNCINPDYCTFFRVTEFLLSKSPLKIALLQISKTLIIASSILEFLA